MEHDVLKLENQLCYPLYAASKEIVRLYKPYLDKLGLTYTQYITMMVLWERQQLTIKELGDILYLDSGTLTPLLKKMALNGLIVRERSVIDERNVLVSLTSKGEALKDQAISVPSEIGSCIPLNSDEVKELYRLLYKTLDNLRPVAD